MIKTWLKRQFWYRPIHLKYVAYRAKYKGLPNWRQFYNRGDLSHSIHKKDESLNRILIATATGGHLRGCVLSLGIPPTVEAASYSITVRLTTTV